MSDQSPFRSPTTSRALHYDTPHSLSDGQFERWPVVDGIPYLRTASEGLVALALSELDGGNPDAALVALLTDQDTWWNGPPTDLDELRELVRRRDTVTLREAMTLLRYGPVGDYFAHRWSDPTFLAGLALLEAHWNEPESAFELAGGIGHYARELTRRGVKCISADIVFSKCWLAKQFVAPEAEYVIFDAKDSWPVAGRTFDLVHCQDAFYFLPDQAKVADRLRNVLSDGGVLAVGHLHNDAVAGGAFGPAKTAAEWQTLFPDAHVYDERELRRALLSGERPVQAEWTADPQVEAWAIVEGGNQPRAIGGGLAVPPQNAVLRANPLIEPDGPMWPSERYAAEYGPAATWTDPTSPVAPERDRRLVDLPERW
ncbi:class I SAM-dependent methyltransferase [Qipengyuania atrilutea]|uniref:Class I SAM-dependent methyltransferase n=1 Tax=Qipengyuania atrilutea TaxID=2744473 RepID=A0A850H638_9SPHN|nr:methyltransferase domain-containing protein [Actirhodobacter atriluteus]NVD45293.1 class I SAM-dependent methyltransferase [Actirhodobacter atriluteus]